MAKGHALAPRGEPQRAYRGLAQRPTTLSASVSSQPPARGSIPDARQRSAGAGNCMRWRSASPTLASYQQLHYGDERRRLDELAAELGWAESAVRSDVQRLGLGPDRTRSHGAAWAADR